jgi:asparagine synthase (glutamine-hydrolysing)
MSRIVALLHRDQRSVEVDTLRQLVAPLRNQATNGPRFWTMGSAGLAYQCLQIAVTPDDLQPATLEGGLAVCFDGRLDNREELISDFRTELPGDPQSLPDSWLVLACYRRFGDLFASRLNGDYALSLVDSDREKVVLARDVMGVRPLYYWASHHALIAASEIKAILAHPQLEAAPDDDALADRLLGGDPNELRLTLYRRVYRVLPGHSIIVTVEKIVERQHWDFDPMRQVRLKSVEEYAIALRELFAQAVRRRLRSAKSVGVTVSGGLDSSAILCQSEKLRKAGDSNAMVHGISIVFPEGTDAAEERYVAEVEKMYRVRVCRLHHADSRTSDDAAWPWRMEFPSFPGRPWLECLNAARERECSVVLSGFYGDQVMSSAAHVLELMQKFRWLEAHRQILRLASSMRDCSPRSLYMGLIRTFVRDAVPEALMPPFRFLRRLVGRDRFAQLYSKALRERAYRRSQQQHRMEGPFGSRQAEWCYRLAHAAHVGEAFEAYNKIAQIYGQECAYPFADREVVAFMMAIPAEIVACDGKYKGLFRVAMGGILPESIRLRYWKADFTVLEAQAATRLLNDRFQEILAPDALVVARGYANGPALQHAARSLLAGISSQNCNPAMDMTHFLALEQWLRGLDGHGNARGSA